MRAVRERSVARVVAAGIAATALASPAPLAAQVELPADVRLRAPRGFGWRVGDVLELSATFRVPRQVTLDEGSLVRRELPAWLEVRETASTRRDSAGWAIYDLRFRYQVFHVPDGVERAEIPALPLLFASADGGRRVEAAVPAFPFHLSALTDSASVASGPWRPPPPPTAPLRLAGGGLVFLVGVWGAAALTGRRRRRASPLWRARREAARAPDCRSALLALHRGLEARTGAAAFGHDLERLLERWPEAEEDRQALEEFFALSREHFFTRDGGPPASAHGAECLARVNRLADRLARLDGGRG